MDNFPGIFRPLYKDMFPDLNKDRLKCHLRREIYVHVISHPDEKEYYSLDDFNTMVRNITLAKEIVKDIIVELEDLGWKCSTSFGGTGLFIYTDEKPPNCFEDMQEIV